MSDAATPAAKFVEIRRMACRGRWHLSLSPCRTSRQAPGLHPLASPGRTRSPGRERPGSFVRPPPLIDCRTRRPADAHTGAGQLPPLGHRGGTARQQPGCARRLTSPTDLVRPINRLGVDTAYASSLCLGARLASVRRSRTPSSLRMALEMSPSGQIRASPIPSCDQPHGSPRRTSSAVKPAPPGPRYILLLPFYPEPPRERSGGFRRDIDQLRRVCRSLLGLSPDRCRG